MNKQAKRRCYCIFYVAIIVCSIFIISSNVIKAVFIPESTPIHDYDITVQESEKKDLLTEVTTTSTTFKAGEVAKGTVIEHTFSMKNVGDYPLIIYEVIPDCTCTDCSISHKVIMPDEQTDITAKVDTGTKNGVFIVNIIIRANSQEGAHRLTLTGCVI